VIEGFTTSQQRSIARQRHQGRSVESLADEWAVDTATIEAVLAHRDSIDQRNGVIRMPRNEG